MAVVPNNGIWIGGGWGGVAGNGTQGLEHPEQVFFSSTELYSSLL